MARRAGVAISRLRRRYAQLDRLNGELIDDCMAFGRKHRKDDPRWARQAFETVLRLDPAHVPARRHLERMADAPAPEAPSGPAKRWGRPLVRSVVLAQ